MADIAYFSGLNTQGGVIFMNTLRVLAAEDNLINQKIITLALEKHGVSLTIVNNGQLAVNLLTKTNFDVVLMDMQMPVMDGYEATQYIRKELKSSIPIIALTANTFSDEIEACMDAGATAHIAKPFSPASFYDDIIRIVSSRKHTDHDDYPIVDFSYIMELAEDKPGYVEQVLSIFMEYTPDGLATLEQLIRYSDDREEMSRQAHYLKSGLGVVRIKDVQDYLQEIETTAKDGTADRAQLISLLEKIQAQFVKATPLIREKMSNASVI